jgi:hypothetical protein
MLDFSGRATYTPTEVDDGGESPCSPSVPRSAMLSMINNGKAYEAHPAFWAPFVLIGEGGARDSFQGPSLLG